nr:MAG TPA: hypothetical protein [Caudoviricetes sp.]
MMKFYAVFIHDINILHCFRSFRCYLHLLLFAEGKNTSIQKAVKTINAIFSIIINSYHIVIKDCIHDPIASGFIIFCLLRCGGLHCVFNFEVSHLFNLLLFSFCDYSIAYNNQKCKNKL